MTYGMEQIVSKGEECCMCHKILKGESSIYDGQLFCSDKCLGKYMIGKHEDDIEYVKFIDEIEYELAEREKAAQW